MLEASLSHELNNIIAARKINLDNPIQIIIEGMQILDKFKDLPGNEKCEILIKALETIAVGTDGIEGTYDDLINVNVVNTIRVLLKENLLANIITVIADATKGIFDINKLQEVERSCFRLCFP
jgi:hypothetical protein